MSTKRKDTKGRILRNGEVQRADGKYMFRYTDRNGDRRAVYSWKLVDTDKVPDGKKCTESLRDMEKVIQRDLDDGIRTSDANSTTVDELFDTFMALRVDLRESTIVNYEYYYKKYVKDVIGHKRVRVVKSTDIQKLYSDLVNETGLKVTSVQKIHAIVYQIFENAVLDNLIRLNPASNAMKNLNRVVNEDPARRHALTEEEQARFIDFVYHTKPYIKWGQLFTVLLGTGMRIGEALGLRWCDCNFKENTININHELQYKPGVDGEGYKYRISKPKTIAGNRIIPMFDAVRKALLEEYDKPIHKTAEPFIVDGYTDFFFLNKNGKVFTPATVHSTIQSIVNDYNRAEFFLAEEEGREPCYLPKFSAHILRHTFCTRLCENERNIKIVQDVMGHKNIATTMDIYNEATASRKQASFKNLEGKIKLN